MVYCGDASTFSVDVDSASYALTRSALLQERRLPPPDSVRVEELLVVGVQGRTRCEHGRQILGPAHQASGTIV